MKRTLAHATGGQRGGDFLIPLAAVAAALPLSAQSNAERILNDRYSRQHDYDLVHQRIELSRFDWERRSFDGLVTVTLRALRPGFDSVVLDAGALLEIQSVAGLPGRGGESPGRRAAEPSSREPASDADRDDDGGG